MKTCVPTSTWSNSHSASGLRMRMQPWEAEYPIDAASGVPWMPTFGAESPIQRVPSGFPGPGGIGAIPRAHAEAGGYHHGLRCLTTTRNVPVGVAWPGMPVATANERQRRARPATA